MRRRHEYLEIAEFTNAVFQDDRVRDLHLRWFDPTQAYCIDRIDKGLAEALMLKRAKCTLYLAQELDTLGKDSELASTLASRQTCNRLRSLAHRARRSGLGQPPCRALLQTRRIDHSRTASSDFSKPCLD